MKYMFKYISVVLLFIGASVNAQSTIQLMKKKSVIIIGGGISGLAAAHKLKSEHIDVLVLEAQSVLGGRLKTDRTNGVVFDEGASWIHGPLDNPISALAQKAKMQTVVTKDSSLIVYNEEGELYGSTDLDNNEDRFNFILDDIGGRKNISVFDYFNKHYPELLKDNLWIYMLSAYLEFDSGGDITKLSSKYFYDDKAFKGEDQIVTNGYDKIIEYLSHEIPVELNTIVNQIDYTNKTVEIITNKDTYYADYVLVTVPLGVLKKESIVFSPTLRRKTYKAIEYLQMGTVNKFLCVWDDAFWNVNKQYIGYTSKEKGKFNYFLNIKKINNDNALMTFAFGEYSKETEEMNDSEIEDAIMEHLRKIYGESIPSPKVVKRTYWNSNPFTYGSYSYVGLGGKSRYYNYFSQPKKSHLYFAGEHTSKDFRGTVHGAYLSGIREANRILKVIR